MSALNAVSLLPFVPSGSDFEASRRLFAELGFTEEWENSGYAGFRSGNAQFILQEFDDRTFASNFMVKIIVEDLDAWWHEASSKQLEKTFTGFSIKAPRNFAWGREVNFIDLAGVCWHVAES